MIRFSSVFLATLLGCSPSPTVERSDQPDLGGSSSAAKLRFAKRSGSVARMRYSTSDPLTLHVTATLEPTLLPSGISNDDSAWIVVRCQDGRKVLSGRGYRKEMSRSKYPSALVRLGRDSLPRRCGLDVYAGEDETLLGSYCISDRQLTAGACSDAIEAVAPGHEELRVDWWAAQTRPDGIVAINLGVEHGAGSGDLRKAQVVIRCPTKRGRIVDGFEVATATPGAASGPELHDIESEVGFVLGPTQWPNAARLDNCDLTLRANINADPTRPRHREVFERACWREGTIHRGACREPATPRPASAASTRPFRADAMIRETGNDVFPWALVVELQANPGTTGVDVAIDGSCTVDGKQERFGTPIHATELERLEPGDIMRDEKDLLKSMPSRCRVDFATESLGSKPAPFASVCLADGKSIPC